MDAGAAFRSDDVSWVVVGGSNSVWGVVVRLVTLVAVVSAFSACAAAPSLESLPESPFEPSDASTSAGSAVGAPPASARSPSSDGSAAVEPSSAATVEGAAPSTTAGGEVGSSIVAPSSLGEGELGGRFVSVSAGFGYSCGLREGGGVECWEWGPHLFGEHWWGMQQDSWSGDPVLVFPPAGLFVAVSAGWGNACGLRPGGGLECWGPNRNEIVSPPPGSFTGVSVGLEHACATRTDGGLECWGSSGVRRPVSFPPEGVFTDFVVGDEEEGGFGCGLREDHSVECWGAGYTAAIPQYASYWGFPSGDALLPLRVPVGEFLSLQVEGSGATFAGCVRAVRWLVGEGIILRCRIVTFCLRRVSLLLFCL